MACSYKAVLHHDDHDHTDQYLATISVEENLLKLNAENGRTILHHKI